MPRVPLVALIVLLAACDARTGSLPGIEDRSAGSASHAVALSTAGQSLYVSGADQVAVYPLDAAGTATPIRTISGPFAIGAPGNADDSAIGAIGGGRGGTVTVAVFEVIRGQDGGPPTTYACHLYVYASGADGQPPPIATPNCPGDVGPLAVVGHGDGGTDYLVNSSQVLRTKADGSTVVRLSSTGNPFLGFTEDAAGNAYLTEGQHIKVYAPPANGGALALVRTVKLPETLFSIAVAPDGTIYAAGATYLDPNYSAWSVFAVSPGGAVRTIGPFDASVGALATDAAGNVYVGLNELRGHTKIKVFPPGATGNSPIRILQDPALPPLVELGGFTAITGIIIQ